MGVVNIKSTIVAAGDSTPATRPNAVIIGAPLQSAVATVEVANGDSIASVYRLFRVPSNILVRSIKLFCDAITSAAGDVGVYRTLADGGAVVKAACFGSAVSIATASTVGIDVTFEADATDGNADDFGLADIEKPLWQVLNLAKDPGVQYDIAVTLTAAATAAGTLAGHLTYVQ